MYYVYSQKKNEYIQLTEEEVEKLTQGMIEKNGKTLHKYHKQKEDIETTNSPDNMREIR